MNTEQQKSQEQKGRASTRVATYVREVWKGRRPQLAKLCRGHGVACTAAHLHDIASGRRKGSPKLIQSIVEISGGVINHVDGAYYCYDKWAISPKTVKENNHDN